MHRVGVVRGNQEAACHRGPDFPVRRPEGKPQPGQRIVQESGIRTLPAAVADTNNRFLDQVDRLTDAMVQAQRALEVTADRIYRG